MGLEVILIKTSDSTNPFSRNVFPVETKSTIDEHIPSFGANSIAPLSLIHSTLIPLSAK